jgi:hypothetical protein
LTFWQKCVWVGAAALIVVSLLMITRTAETSSPAPAAAATGQAEYFTFQDNTHAETHYAVREGDRAVIYNSMPAGR